VTDGARPVPGEDIGTIIPLSRRGRPVARWPRAWVPTASNPVESYPRVSMCPPSRPPKQRGRARRRARPRGRYVRSAITPTRRARSRRGAASPSTLSASEDGCARRRAGASATGSSFGATETSANAAPGGRSRSKARGIAEDSGGCSSYPLESVTLTVCMHPMEYPPQSSAIPRTWLRGVADVARPAPVRGP